MKQFLVLLALLVPGALSDLPQTFNVTSYALNLTVTSDLSATVDGTVVINLSCILSTTNIVLHWGSSLIPSQPSKSNLMIFYTAKDTTDVKNVTVSNIEVNSVNQLNITTDTTFYVEGVVTLTANFQTIVNGDNKGLFFRQYPIGNNQNNVVVMSNLWPTFARELFPCLDEPQYSAQTTLTLSYPDSWVVAATAPTASSTSDKGLTTTTFHEVNLPPSSLAFFLASNMSALDFSVRSTTKLSFWGRKSLPPSTFYVNAQFLADYYYSVEDLVGITLPNGQLTVVMVPGLEEPFAGYGVIFVREDNYALDYTDPQMEGLFKSNVAPVIYQFLRQFSEFSKYRPSSWSDYWVSQAVAKYLQYVILQTVVPLLDFETELEVVARQTALSLDSKLDSKPLYDTSIQVDSTAAVQAAVNDPLKSLKGASILNMLDQCLPAGSVFAAIKSFFLDNNMNSAITSDKFLAAIQTIQATTVLSPSAKNALNRTLGYWFNTVAYPLETVKVYKSTSQDSLGVVSFTTSAFCSVFNSLCSPDLPGDFYLSATVGSKSENRYYTPRQDFWVSNEAANKTVNTTIDVQDNDWIVANMRSGGYYRSNYDPSNWERIISALSSGDQRLLGRTQLLDDAFALALSSSDALNYNITVRLALSNLGNNLYRDWVPVQRGLRGFKENLQGLDAYTSYSNFAAEYFFNLNQYLQNTSNDAFEKARIQALFLDDMCESDVKGYRTYALGNLTSLLTGNLPSMVPSSAYDAMACCGARYSSNIKAQTLWNILSDSTLNYYNRRFASVALGCLSNYSDISQLFKIMTAANVQLKPYIQVALEKVAEKTPVKFLTNFTTLVEDFQAKLGAVSVASLIKLAGRKINNITYAAMLDLQGKNIDPLVITTAKNTVNEISYRVKWLSTNNWTLVSALQSHTTTVASANVPTVTALLVILSSLLFIKSIGI